MYCISAAPKVLHWEFIPFFLNMVEKLHLKAIVTSPKEGWKERRKEGNKERRKERKQENKSCFVLC